MVIPITFSFKYLKEYFGIVQSAAMVGAVCLLIAFYALYHLEETFHKDLNFLEK
jgi:hypothetical protein